MDIKKPWHRKRRASAASLMGNNFLKLLDKGVLIDRNKVHSDGKSRKKIPVPKGLQIMRRPT